MHPKRIKCVVFIVFWFVFLSAPSSAQPPALQGDALAKQVSAARAAVDELVEQLESHRRVHRDEAAGLRAERAELKRQIRLEEIRRDTFAEILQERTRRFDDQQGRLLTLLAPIQRAVRSAKRYVSTTLPFKQEERLRRLAKLESDLSVTHPDLGRALTSLWRFIEEEEAMAKEIGLAQQVIELDGQRLLVDVARVGMALLYFRLPGGGVGWAVQRDDGWRFERLKSVDARQTILSIFRDLEKNQPLGAKRLLISTELPKPLNRKVR